MESKTPSKQPAAPKSPILLRVNSCGSLQALREAQRRASQAGYDGVEWPLPTPLDEDVDAPGGLGEDWFVGSDQPEPALGVIAASCAMIEVDRAADTLIALLHRAPRLQAQCVNLTIPPIGHGGRNGFARYQEAVNFAHGLLDRVRFDAEVTGVPVAVEAGVGGVLLSPVELRGLIDKANSWAVGVCLDVERIARFGLPEDWVRTLAYRIHSVRIPGVAPVNAAPPEAAARRGDFAAAQAALDETENRRPIIVNPQNESC